MRPAVSEAARDAQRFGMDAATVQAITARDLDEGVWPENVATVTAFLAVDTQWRVIGGFGPAVVMGFDYAGVRAGLAMARIRLTPALWADLQLMERAARAALNEKNA